MKRFLWCSVSFLMVALSCLISTAASARTHVAPAVTGTWTSMIAPNPDGNSSPEGVSCLPNGTQQFCMMVGEIVQPTGTFAETFNGTQWTLSKTLDVTGTEYDTLLSVSCTSVKRCVSVGQASKGTDVSSLVELWNGTSWRIINTPAPPGSTYYSLSGISCVSSEDCVAVGQYAASYLSDSSSAMAETWNGSRWTLTKVPVSGITGNSDEVSLNSVSCVPSKRSATPICMALGANQTQAPAYINLLELWNGTKWTETSPVGQTQYILYGISCPETTQCLATGYNSMPPYLTAEDWNGTSWSVVSPSAYPSSTSPSLNIASCPNLNVCMTVGEGMLGGNETQSFSDFWNGSTWTLQILPGNKPGILQTLTGLSCISAASCITVGFKAGVKGQSVPVVLEYS